ncbi:MAG: 4Fe-4S binding protein [Candidatus Marinimicrobia bacterium]|nr:4Fe-4S binding protein [Candidatus Neomarinimicrobiota bacterium]
MIVPLDHCDQCGTCISVCPVDALMLTENSLIVDHKLCTECLLCVNICPVAALESKK